MLSKTGWNSTSLIVARYATLYQYVIETAPYFAKKYQKGTLEEKISKFKKDVMSKVVTP